MWAELFNLSENSGKTFEIDSFHFDGEVRIEIAGKWFRLKSAPKEAHGTYLFMGKDYTDFAVVPAQSTNFHTVSRERAIVELAEE